MAIAAGLKQNFETLINAVQNGNVALMDCQLAATGEPVAVVCAANRLPDGEIEFVPFATLFDGNPYATVNPPNPDGGFFTQDAVWSDTD